MEETRRRRESAAVVCGLNSHSQPVKSTGRKHQFRMRLSLLIILFLFVEVARGTNNHFGPLHLNRHLQTNLQVSDSIPDSLDYAATITIKEFNFLVDGCIKLLQTKQLVEMSDSEHKQIILCINTRSSRCEHCGDFSSLLLEKSYFDKILTIYPDWLPSLGLGFYFPKLKVGLMGAPNPRYRYRLIE